MSISDIIAKKKREFFVARDTDKLQLQKAALERERKAVEAENLARAKKLRLQEDVKREQQKLKLARGAKNAKTRATIKKAFGALQEGARRVQTEAKGFRGSGGFGGSGPFNPTSNPFGKDKAPAPQKTGTKRIVINIKE